MAVLVRLLLGLGCLLLSSLPSGAQDNPPGQLTVTMNVDDAMLIVQTLGAIECRTVAQMATCEHAATLLKVIRDQATKQGK